MQVAAAGLIVVLRWPLPKHADLVDALAAVAVAATLAVLRCGAGDAWLLVPAATALNFPLSERGL